jgi:AraC-like DNA-binding protein
MNYSEAAPHPALSKYVDAYWTASGSSKTSAIEKILPDGCVDIIFNVGNDCYTDNGAVLMKNERTYLVGTMTKFKETEMDTSTRLVGIRFKPGTFLAFFNYAPLCDVANRTVEMDTRFCFNTDLMIRSPFNFLDKLLFTNLKSPNQHLLEQIQSVQKSKGQIKIDELACAHCTTVRQLERNFKQYLGISPKEFVNLVRYQNVKAAIEQRKPGESLLSIAFDFGYYDHAHLTNHFTEHHGCAPSSL